MKVEDLLLELRIGGDAGPIRPRARFVSKIARRAIEERETVEAELADRQAEVRGLDADVRSRLAGNEGDDPGQRLGLTFRLGAGAPLFGPFHQAAVKAAADFQACTAALATMGVTREEAAAAMESVLALYGCVTVPDP